MALLTRGFGVVQSLLTCGMGGRIPHTSVSGGFEATFADPSTFDLSTRGSDGDVDSVMWVPTHESPYNGRALQIYTPWRADPTAGQIGRLAHLFKMLRPLTMALRVRKIRSPAIIELLSEEVES